MKEFYGEFEAGRALDTPTILTICVSCRRRSALALSEAGAGGRVESCGISFFIFNSYVHGRVYLFVVREARPYLPLAMNPELDYHVLG